MFTDGHTANTRLVVSFLSECVACGAQGSMCAVTRQRFAGARYVDARREGPKRREAKECMWFEEEADTGVLKVDEEVAEARVLLRRRCRAAAAAASIPLNVRLQQQHKRDGAMRDEASGSFTAGKVFGSAYSTVKSMKTWKRAAGMGAGAGSSTPQPKEPQPEMPADFIPEESPKPPPPKYVPAAEGDASKLPPEAMPEGDQSKYAC